MSSREELKNQVSETLMQKHTFKPDLLKSEISFWFDELGLPQQYFLLSTADQICGHVESYMAARVLASASGSPFDIRLRQESEKSALLFTRSFVVGSDKKLRLLTPDKQPVSPVVEMERYIEKKYLTGKAKIPEEESNKLKAQLPHESLSYVMQKGQSKPDIFRLQAYRSKGCIDSESKVHIRFYFLQAPEFANPTPKEGETNIEELGDVNFLKYTDQQIKDIYQSVMDQAVKTLSPVVHVVPKVKDGDSESALVMIAHRQGLTHSYFTGIPDVYRFYHMYATKKYVEPFSNGMVFFSFYLRSLDSVMLGEHESKPSQNVDSRLAHVARDAALHFVLPRSSLTPLLGSAKLSVQQVVYAYAAWKFAFHFLNRSNEAYEQVAEALRKVDPNAMSALSSLQASLRQNAFTEGSILDIIYSNTKIVEWLYNDFASRHMPQHLDRRPRVFSENDEGLNENKSLKEGQAFLRKTCHTDADYAVFSTFLAFNHHILKTNFYCKSITALSFRLDPGFLPKSLYPETPFGVFYVVGSEFRGFHVRFADVARGGIRLVRSRFSQDYAQNVATIFEECYNLSNTQQRKNKDIPEGGSKGVILLNLAHQDKGEACFKQFVDSILDLLLTEDSMVDLYKQEELLFLGPDEGTADYMDWASLHAKSRGYSYWKAFTTGKSLTQGGIPHDLYGMTTRSVRAYVLGIERKKGLEPSECVKMQTGGPDGDLGSNEIKLGLEKTIGIVDGSGVLFDPQGINSEELLKLATARQMIKHFNKRLLSDDGFMVLIDQSDIELPDGRVIESGLQFRNTFHLNGLAKGDFFVPCGGRPAAVNAHNVQKFLHDDNGNLRFKYVVEGANLFFTQEARMQLEEAGLVVIKDASANKGGVTSSSLEVLAALSFTDEEFAEHVALKEGAKEPPKFYQEYVKEVQSIITRNAELEFECIWREHENSGTTMTEISDNLSNRITKLSRSIENSDSLWENSSLRQNVLVKAIPKTLQAQIGLDNLLSRLPVSYQKALFSSFVASRFIYQYGVDTAEFAFFDYVQELLHLETTA